MSFILVFSYICHSALFLLIPCVHFYRPPLPTHPYLLCLSAFLSYDNLLFIIYLGLTEILYVRYSFLLLVLKDTVVFC